MEFQTKVEVSLYDYELTGPSGEKTKVNVIHGHAVLSWSVEIEARSWGIKGIWPLIPDQIIRAEVEIDDENGDAQTLEIDLNLKDVDVNMQPENYGMISPSEIIFFKNSWEVT